jgi:hypothetical protein
MNKDRRARLQSAADVIRDVMDEEQAAYDNLPENFAAADRGQNMSEAIDSMDEALNSLDEVIQK